MVIGRRWKGQQERKGTAGIRLETTDSNSYDVVMGSQSETDGEKMFLREEKDGFLGKLTSSHHTRFTCSETIQGRHFQNHLA